MGHENFTAAEPRRGSAPRAKPHARAQREGYPARNAPQPAEGGLVTDRGGSLSPLRKTTPQDYLRDLYRLAISRLLLRENQRGGFRS